MPQAWRRNQRRSTRRARTTGDGASLQYWRALHQRSDAENAKRLALVADANVVALVDDGVRRTERAYRERVEQRGNNGHLGFAGGFDLSHDRQTASRITSLCSSVSEGDAMNTWRTFASCMTSPVWKGPSSPFSPHVPLRSLLH